MTPPLCSCHGVPRYRSGQCAVAERRRNARRIRMKVGGVDLFLGRAQSDAELTFARSLIRQLKEVTSGRVHA